MKYFKKLIIVYMIFIVLIGVNNIGYAADRFVDIPMPPNSSGKADFTSEDGEKEAEKYQENEITDNNIDENIDKSGNNYLKSLYIEGYTLEPQFNMEEDEYILYVKDRSKINSLNVIAEPDDIKSRIEGIGEISITEDTKIININVIAENGNLKVYTIRIENQLENRTENQMENQIENIGDKEEKINPIIGITIIILIIIVIGVVKKKIEKS